MVQSDKNEWRKQHEGVCAVQLQLFECSYPKIVCVFGGEIKVVSNQNERYTY